MPRILPLVNHALYAAFMAFLFVTAGPFERDMAFWAWPILLFVFVLIHRIRTGRDVRAARLLVQVVVYSLCVGLAVIAPVKDRNRLMAEPVILPKTKMTLRELQKYADNHWLGTFPDADLVITEDQAKDMVRFSSRKMTLREFVRQVEAQTTLRHRFGACGNGGSILFGSNCDFGLTLVDFEAQEEERRKQEEAMKARVEALTARTEPQRVPAPHDP